MNDLETRLRDGLLRRAGPPLLPTMPPGTIGRVRRRQAVVSSVATFVVIALAATGIGLFRTTPSNVGSASGSLRPPASLLERVPEGWPSVDILDPSGAYPAPAAGVDAADGVRVRASGPLQGRGVSFHAGREVDPERPVGGVAERVAGEEVARDHEPVERPVERALPGCAGGAVALAQAHARPAVAGASGAKNGVET